jgi:ribosomal protein S14
MKSKYFNGLLKRKKFFLNKDFCLLLKSVYLNNKINHDHRQFVYQKLCKISLNSSLVRINNFCIYTNRSKGVNNIFKFDRVLLRSFLLSAKIYGCRRSIW